MNAEQALNRILNDPALAHEKQRLLDRLDEGRRQLDEGDYIEFDEEGLRLFFDALIERATEQ